MLTKVQKHFSFRREVAQFLSQPLSAEECKRQLKERLANRCEHFLCHMQRWVYGNPHSPYLPLLQDAGIVRNRLKIQSAIGNARAFLAVQREFGSFDRYVWRFVGGESKQNCWRTMKQVPASTPESDAMSKDLKKRGFRFVGSTICYAFMQATGMVNDHLVTCFRYREINDE